MTPEFKYTLGIVLWIGTFLLAMIEFVMEWRWKQYLKEQYPGLNRGPWPWKWNWSGTAMQNIKQDPRWQYHQRWSWFLWVLTAGSAFGATQLSGVHLLF